MSLMLASIANGDAAAFERLYQATSSKIYGVVLRIVRRHDLAFDVMEESYLHIWKTAAKFDPALASPMGWMMAIARARAIDLARRPDIVANDADPEIADNESPGALSRRELTDELKRLLTCIGRLDPRFCRSHSSHSRSGGSCPPRSMCSAPSTTRSARARTRCSKSIPRSAASYGSGSGGSATCI